MGRPHPLPVLLPCPPDHPVTALFHLGALGPGYWLSWAEMLDWLRSSLLLVMSISGLLSSDGNSLSDIEVMQPSPPSSSRDRHQLLFFTWTLPYGHVPRPILLFSHWL